MEARTKLALQGALREVLEEFDLAAMAGIVRTADGLSENFHLAKSEAEERGAREVLDAGEGDVSNPASLAGMIHRVVETLVNLTGPRAFDAVLLVGVREGEPVCFAKEGAMTDAEMGSHLLALGAAFQRGSGAS